MLLRRLKQDSEIEYKKKQIISSRNTMMWQGQKTLQTLSNCIQVAVRKKLDQKMVTLNANWNCSYYYCYSLLCCQIQRILKSPWYTNDIWGRIFGV